MTPIPSDATAIIKAELAARIDAARDALEDHGLDELTALRRGEIRAYRSLLAWIEPAVIAPEPEDRRIFPEPPPY